MGNFSIMRTPVLGQTNGGQPWALRFRYGKLPLNNGPPAVVDVQTLAPEGPNGLEGHWFTANQLDNIAVDPRDMHHF